MERMIIRLYKESIEMSIEMSIEISETRNRWNDQTLMNSESPDPTADCL